MPAPEDLEVFQKHQAARLIRDLKDYAFSLSPGFQRNHMSRVDTSKSFYMQDPNSSTSEVKLKLVFYAFRSLGIRKKPSYDFTVRASTVTDIGDVPYRYIAHLEEDTLEEISDVPDESGLTETQTSTYQVSQSGLKFITVANDYELKLYGDTICQISTDDMHLSQQGEGIRIPADESFDGDSHIIAPLKVEHTDESVVDSPDKFTDAVEKLERELALQAILSYNNLDVRRGFYDFDDSINKIRLLIYTLQTGKLDAYKSITNLGDDISQPFSTRHTNPRKEL
ncbi:MAG: hypothetical protein ABIQ04_04990 [Candidatus Saccharimonadales bacterium]